MVSHSRNQFSLSLVVIYSLFTLVSLSNLPLSHVQKIYADVCDKGKVLIKQNITKTEEIMRVNYLY